jgi:L-arabinose isomerase
MDYKTFNKIGDRTKMTGEWLAHCGACPVPEIANAFNRTRIGFHQITGTLQSGDPAWQERARRVPWFVVMAWQKPGA